MTKTTAQATSDEFNNNTSVEILRMQTHRGLKELCLEKNSIFLNWQMLKLTLLPNWALLKMLCDD